VFDCSIQGIKFFAGGSFVSFTFDSESGCGIGVLDIERSKTVCLWKETGRLKERGRCHDHIVFANHPVHPIVVWAGPRLSLCNFLSGAEPIVLRGIAFISHQMWRTSWQSGKPNHTYPGIMSGTSLYEISRSRIVVDIPRLSQPSKFPYLTYQRAIRDLSEQAPCSMVSPPRH